MEKVAFKESLTEPSGTASRNYGTEGNLNLKLIVTLKRCLNSVVKNIHPLLLEAGLTESQFGILEVLYHLGPMPICRLMKKTLSTGGNMTVVIDNLKKQKLIDRNHDPKDRRSYIISLTAKGEALIKKIFPVHVKNLSTILKGLNSEEKMAMIELAKKLGKSV